MRHHNTFKLYLTGRESDGITETLFRKTVAAFNKRLAESKADTVGFVLKTFNR
ncbi:hypothetical protein [Chitinophaga lutea]|uniref:hypothetical protein n=1 Tax=Chitinophaga lutea TaxID=2488634 RepID=UPI0013151A0D|nr:hypothetical protein [Chitinophaga lutea]